MSAGEWVGLFLIAFGAIPAFVYFVVKMAVKGYYSGKAEGITLLPPVSQSHPFWKDN